MNQMRDGEGEKIIDMKSMMMTFTTIGVYSGLENYDLRVNPQYFTGDIEF